MLKEQETKIKQKIEDKTHGLPKFPFTNFINSHKRLIILLSILLVFIAVTGITAWQMKLFPKNLSIANFFKQGSHTSSTATPRPSPRPIPHGKIDFTVGQSDKTVPQFSKGSIDPYDPAKGATQTVTIAIKHTQPVTKVTATLKTDNVVSNPVLFTLISGTATDGQWQGSWQVTDTYLYTYKLILEATGGAKTASDEITLR